MDRADTADGLRYMVCDLADSPAVLQLCLQHPFLDVPGKGVHKRQQEQEQQGKSAVLDKDYHKNADDLAEVGCHADDPGGKEILDRVYVADKAGDNDAGFLFDEGVGVQCGELFAHGAPESVRHFLSDDRQEAFPPGFQKSGQQKETEIEKRQGEGNFLSGGQKVDDLFQD